MKWLSAITLRLLPIALLALRPGYGADVPTFEEFSVPEVFQGKPVAPRLKGSSEELRTRINEAAKEGPDFAGHYTIVIWGCGSACALMAIINTQTGAAKEGPFRTLGHFWTYGYYGDTADTEAPYIDYRVNSRLLVLRGCPEDKEKKCGTYYYEWAKDKFKLLRMIPVSRVSR
jgi:hypothetical protein